MKERVIGITFGAFDLLHTGHVVFLSACAEQCDRLVVGLHTDPSSERQEKACPIQTTMERFIQLQSCVHVDEVFPYDTEADLVNALETFMIHRRFMDDSYTTLPFTGREECKTLGIEVVFIPRKHSWSSTELRERMIDARDDDRED